MRLRSAFATLVAPATLASVLLIGAAPAALAAPDSAPGRAPGRVPGHDDCRSLSLSQSPEEDCAGRADGAHAGAGAARKQCAAGRAGSDVPVDTRIQDGAPTVYRAGGGYRIWTIVMKNTGAGICHDLHPVVDLVDSERTLKDGQIRLEFREPAAHRWHPVPFTRTDEDGHIGPFDDGFAGYTVPAGRTVRVDVRLAFTRDTAPQVITAHATVVRRHGDDGERVGESGGYRFSVQDASGTGPGAASGTGPGGTTAPEGAARPGGPLPGWATVGDVARPDELAGTGHRHLRTPAAIACTCLMLGAALVVGSRRPRVRRRRPPGR